MKQVRVVLLLSFAQLFCCAQAQYRVEFVLIADTRCNYSESDVADWPANVRVEYRGMNSSSWRPLRNLMDVEKSDTQLCNKTAAVMASPTLHTRQGTFPSDFEVGDGEGIELRFVQTNHRGGYCDCWGLACDILLLNSSDHIVNTIKKQQISCSDSESSGSGYFEEQSENAGGSSGGTSDDIILYGSSNSSGSDSIDVNDVSGSGAEGLLHSASVEDNSSMIERSTYSNYSGSGSVESNTTSGSGLPTVNETSGLGSSLSGCPLDTIQRDIKYLPSHVCGGSASVERGFVTGFTHPDEPSCMFISTNSSIIITEQRDHGIRMNDKCDVTEPYLEIMFAYIFRSLDSFDEGLELSFQSDTNGRGRWIPLWFFSAQQSTVRTVHDIDLGDIMDEGLLSLRGYPVNFTVSENYSEANIKICGPGVFNDQSAKGLFNWRFRWLQTVANDPMDGIDEDDAIYIYKVSIMVNDTQQLLLFQDHFSTENLSSEKWSVPRNVKQQKNCGGLNDSCLEFSSSTGKPPDCAGPITSREVSTVCLNSITQIQYTLITANSSDCPNNGNLTSKFQLQYQWNNLDWKNITELNPGGPVGTKPNACNIVTYNTIVDLRDRDQIRLDQCNFNHLQFRFIQSTEHLGEFCDCWAVANLTATLTSGEVKKFCGRNLTLMEPFKFNTDEVPEWGDDTVIAGFCQYNASEIKVFQTLSDTEELCQSSPSSQSPSSPPSPSLPPTPSPPPSSLSPSSLPQSPSPPPSSLSPSSPLSLSAILRHLLESLDMQRLIVTTYNLSSILRDVGNQTVDLEFSELALLVSSRLLDIAQNNFKKGLLSPDLEDFVAGSTLLRILENFALNNHDAVHSLVKNDNITLRIEEVIINSINETVSLIEGENARISIPREVVGSVEGTESVRVVSFLYQNMSGLLPESLEGVEMNDGDTDNLILRLASPVISISLQCDGINCTTSNLSTPVEVTFTHSPNDMALLLEDDVFEEIDVTCVFWKFDQQPDSLLSHGQWSTEGCETNSSSPNSTVCHCDHLTNFAILLSAQPIEFPSPQAIALQITGYIGVSVSLVAMAATIFVFVFLKQLRTMRNYIHIQLCVTLGIAQIIFVAGVEPRLGEGGGVSIGCRSVAVLLHYWFLVSFMWMLMEGVVLYVELVRVFVTQHARYIAAFTIASYGLPLLYMGALTLPLGFVRTEHYREYHPYDYGYEQACYLSPHTSFVWSLLAPVILIFLANIGFFIMAIVIMFRHQKRQHTDKKTHKIKLWIKASVSLTMVMGITWIIGFLVIEVKELFALAYIFTIFVAFQGVFIFVIFVLLSKQVRENYTKWWKAKVAESDFLSKHFGGKTLGTGLSAQNKTPIVTPSYDKTDRKSSNTASKGYHLEAEKSQVIEIENFYSQHKLPTAPQNSESCDDESHRSFVIGGGATPLLGATPLTENGFDNIMVSPQNRTLIATPSHDKIDQETSSTASKEDLGHSRATEIENSYSQHKPLSIVPLNSIDNKSHRITDDGIGATPLTENNCTFNIIYIPSSIPTDVDSTTLPPDNNPLMDTKDKDTEGSSSTMEEVELHTKRATPNDYVLTNSFIYDQLTEGERSTKL